MILAMSFLQKAPACSRILARSFLQKVPACSSVLHIHQVRLTSNAVRTTARIVELATIIFGHNANWDTGLKFACEEFQQELRAQEQALEIAEVRHQHETYRLQAKPAMLELDAVARSQRAYLEMLFEKAAYLLEQSQEVSEDDKKRLKTRKMTPINAVMEDHWKQWFAKVSLTIASSDPPYRKPCFQIANASHASRAHAVCYTADYLTGCTIPSWKSRAPGGDPTA